MVDTYCPDGKFLWDPWFIERDGVFHLFHLQAERTNKPDDRHHNLVSIGHATSNDLNNWQTLPTAISPGNKGEWDDLSLWTGCVYEDQGIYFLFYTGRTKDQDEFWVQRIGVATSTDLLTWTKHPSNPILEADNHYYHMSNAKNALNSVPAFRDPFIFKDQQRGKYLMLFTGRDASQPPEYNGCVGLAESDDLFTWKFLPPLLAPHRYDEMEVPQLLIHEGKYYLFFMTFSKFTLPSWGLTKGHHDGLHCYAAKELFGEYQPVNGNGVVEHEDGLLGLRLIKKEGEGYQALGWLNKVESGESILKLSGERKVIIEDIEVKVV